MIDYRIIEPTELNFRQRWASYLTIFVTVVALFAAFLLRSRSLDTTADYENREEGITAHYPLNWLLEEGKGDFVFRAEDPAAIPFKTTLQLALVPVGPGARTDDLPDWLNMTRAASLAAYRPLAIKPVTLANGVQGIQMDYAYVSSEGNPFFQSVPVVVRAIDVIVLRSNQALVVTYRSDSQAFEQNQHYFDNFLRTLEFNQ